MHTIQLVGDRLQLVHLLQLVPCLLARFAVLEVGRLLIAHMRGDEPQGLPLQLVIHLGLLEVTRCRGCALHDLPKVFVLPQHLHAELPHRVVGVGEILHKRGICVVGDEGRQGSGRKLVKSLKSIE